MDFAEWAREITRCPTSIPSTFHENPKPPSKDIAQKPSTDQITAENIPEYQTQARDFKSKFHQSPTRPLKYIARKPSPN